MISVSHKGPDRIVDQDNIVRRRPDCVDRMGHRLLAVLAALHQFNLPARKFFIRLQASLKAGHLVGAQGHINFRDLRAGSELAQGVNKDRRSPDLGKLFGCSRLLTPGIRGRGHACPQARRRNDDHYLHRGL